MKWLKRITLGVVGLVLLAAMAGAGYEALARRRAARDFPPPGQLVDVGGGRRMQLDCRGSGSPIVVLEAGLDTNGSLSWATVHDSLAAISRTCAYSRAGVMWSDQKPGPHDADHVADDLKALLTAAGEPGPYVMAGHSLGGPYIMTFTRHFPADVAGLVFVDASHPDQKKRFEEAVGGLPEPGLTAFRIGSALGWTGLVRFLAPVGRNDKIPDQVEAAMAAYLPTSLPGLLAEYAALDTTMAEGGMLRDLGDRPIVVLTAMAPMDSTVRAAVGLDEAGAAKFQQTWNALHVEEASWSTRSEHVVVPDATHYIQVDRPDVVIGAVRRVVDLVRQPGPAPDPS
ncbi:MAG: alpha/beta hydrolase [Gemmatimonadales bacterium]